MINQYFKKNGFEAIEAEYLKAAKYNHSEIFEFPSEDIQVITNGLKGEETAQHALVIFKELAKNIEKFEVCDNPQILDYGCGWGRITRLFASLSSDANIYGVDVNNRLISSAKQCAKTIAFSEIQSMGALPFANNSFDLVFANSVFSHLSEKSSIFTLSELVRILNTNGKIIISVLELEQMNKFYSHEKKGIWIEKILGDQESAKKTLSRDNFVWSDTKRWDNYGIAIMNDDWLNNNLKNMSANLVASYKTKLSDSQNYKVIIKN